MSLLDHLSLGVNDLTEARTFYDAIFNALDIPCLAEGDGFAAFGHGRVEFLLLQPFDGQPANGGNGTHVAFAAPSEAAVSAAHAAGLTAGGSDEGAPGPREDYPMPVFTSFLRDPVGNKVEIIHNGFSA